MLYRHRPVWRRTCRKTRRGCSIYNTASWAAPWISLRSKLLDALAVEEEVLFIFLARSFGCHYGVIGAKWTRWLSVCPPLNLLNVEFRAEVPVSRRSLFWSAPYIISCPRKGKTWQAVDVLLMPHSGYSSEREVWRWISGLTHRSRPPWLAIIMTTWLFFMFMLMSSSTFCKTRRSC
jgi:hypothetical protein